MDIRDKVYERLSPARSTRPRLYLSLQWAALVTLTVIVSAGAAYALWPPGPTPDSGLVAVEADNLIVPINQTKTLTFDEPVRSLDVTLDYAYADSNRIAVGYHINGVAEAGSSAELWLNMTLMDAESQQEYVWLLDSQLAKDYFPSTDSDETLTIAGLTHFDAAAITGTPAVLNLLFRLEFAYSTADMRASEPNGAFGLGVADFSFTVPYNPGRTIVAEQTAEVNDMTITIQNVVIAPSLTRLEFCVSDPRPFAVETLTWEALVSLDVNASRIFTDRPAALSGIRGGVQAPDSDCRALTIPEALTEHTGAWTITLNGFRNRESGQAVPGVWTFAFDVD